MDLIVYLGGGAGALLLIGTVLRWLWRANRRIVQAAEAAPKILNLVQELSPNHGHSIKDQITDTARDVAEIKAAFADHLNNHPGG